MRVEKQGKYKKYPVASDSLVIPLLKKRRGLAKYKGEPKVYTTRLEAIGKRFGKLVVTSYTNYRTSSGGVLYFAKCDCGNSRVVSKGQLFHSTKPLTSCGCDGRWARIEKKLLGQKIGELRVLYKFKKDHREQRIWRCVCSCGRGCDKITAFLTAKKKYPHNCGCRHQGKLKIKVRKSLAKQEKQKTTIGVKRNEIFPGG